MEIDTLAILVSSVYFIRRIFMFSCVRVVRIFPILPILLYRLVTNVFMCTNLCNYYNIKLRRLLSITLLIEPINIVFCCYCRTIINLGHYQNND